MGEPYRQRNAILRWKTIRYTVAIQLDWRTACSQFYVVQDKYSILLRKKQTADLSIQEAIIHCMVS